MLLLHAVQFLIVYLQIVISTAEKKDYDYFSLFCGRQKKKKPLVDKSRLEQVE